MTRKPPKVTSSTPIGTDVSLIREAVRAQSGRRVTQRTVEEIVTEARRVGRPGMAASGAAPVVPFRLSRRPGEECNCAATGQSHRGPSLGPMNFVRSPGKAASSDLRRLHRSYIAAINQALARDRDDLARELADTYLDEAHRLLADQPASK